jgi:hypothetical protein
MKKKYFDNEKNEVIEEKKKTSKLTECKECGGKQFFSRYDKDKIVAKVCDGCGQLYPL